MEFYSHIKPYLDEIERKMESELGKEDERVYGLLVPFLRRGGKRIRPVMALLCCGASGGSYESVMEPAMIIELFHNFTLIHDDIEDDSQFRRGEPTLHVKCGVPMALNSGDALYTFLWRKIVTLPMRPNKLLRLQDLYSGAFKRVVDGQGIELSWIKNGRFDISEDEYLVMIGGKTSALMGLSCEVGGFVAGAGKRQRKALRDYGEMLGEAFQIHDDVLNVSGSFEKYQKEIGGDISEGKRTLMVVHALRHGTPEDRQRLTSILASHSKKEEDIKEAIVILQKYGSVDYARKKAEKLVAQAKKRVEKLSPSKDRDALLSIADYVVSRER